MRSQTAIVAIKAILSLVYFSFMSRLLTPGEFGYFALITAVTVVLQSLSEAGLGSAVIQKKDASKAYIDTAFTLGLCFGAFFFFLLLIFSEQASEIVSGNKDLADAFRLISPMILLQALNNITWAVYMKKLDFFKFGILQCAACGLSYLIGIYLGYHKFGFYAIIWATLLEQCILTIILIATKKFRFKIAVDKDHVKGILSYGGWLTLSVIIRNLTNELDKVIIGRLLPISDLGAINRPSGFVSRISGQLNGIFDTTLFPILSNISDDKKRVQNAFLRSVSLIVLFSAVWSSFVVLGSKYIIDIFFGSQWEYLQPILMIFGAVAIIHGFSRICDCFFRSLGIVKLYFFMRTINGVILVCLVFIGCKYGLMGVTLALAGSAFTSNIIKFSVLNHYMRLSWSRVFRAFSRNACFPMVLAIICLPILLVSGVGNYITVWIYALLLLITILFFPKLMGDIFVSNISDRFLKKFRNLRLY